MNKKIIGLMAVAVSAGALSACTSSSHKAVDSPTTSSPAVTAPPTTEASTSTTAASAPTDPHTLLLQLADLPAGLWKATPHSPDASRRTNNAYYDACLGVPVIDDNESAVYYSDFARSDSQAFVESEVDVVKSASYASRDIAAVQGPKGLPCQLASAKHDFAETNKTATNKFTALDDSDISGPSGTFGIRLDTNLTSPSGTTLKVVVDTYYLQRGDAEVAVQFTAVGSADTSTETSTLTDLIKRVG